MLDVLQASPTMLHSIMNVAIHCSTSSFHHLCPHANAHIHAMQILSGKSSLQQNLLAFSWTTKGRLRQLVAASLLGAASLGQAHSYSGEPVVAVAALPPALGSSHLLHLMLPALRIPAFCGAATILAVVCGHIQPACTQQL